MEEWATTTAEWMNREIKRENKKRKKFKRRDLNVKHLFNIRNCLLLVGRFIGWLHWRRTTKDGNVAFSRTMVVHFERWLCILRRAVEVAVDAAPQKNLYFGRRRWAFSNFFFLFIHSSPQTLTSWYDSFQLLDAYSAGSNRVLPQSRVSRCAVLQSRMQRPKLRETHRSFRLDRARTVFACGPPSAPSLLSCDHAQPRRRLLHAAISLSHAIRPFFYFDAHLNHQYVFNREPRPSRKRLFSVFDLTKNKKKLEIQTNPNQILLGDASETETFSDQQNK